MTDANSFMTTYQYDGLGRLVTTDYPDPDADVNFIYNAAGQRASMTDGLGVTEWAYDLVGRPITITSPITGTVVGYQYDSSGQRTMLIYPDGKTVSYEYDDLGRMTQVTDWDGGITTYTYDNAGRLQTEVLPNGVTSDYVYNDAGWLLSLVHTTVTGTLSSFEYQYDGVGNRVQAVEILADPAGPTPTPTETPAAVDFGEKNTLAFNLYAPNGTVLIGRIY